MLVIEQRHEKVSKRVSTIGSSAVSLPMIHFLKTAAKWQPPSPFLAEGGAQRNMASA